MSLRSFLCGSFKLSKGTDHICSCFVALPIYIAQRCVLGVPRVNATGCLV